MAQEWKRLRNDSARSGLDEEFIRLARQPISASSVASHVAPEAAGVSRGDSARRALTSMIRLIRGEGSKPANARRQHRPVIRGGRWVRDPSTDVGKALKPYRPPRRP